MNEAAAAGPARLPGGYADTFARLALANIAREYPNHPGHLLAHPGELVPTRIYHPVFYGAYDWHSSVHMHWLAMRLLHRHAPRETADAITGELDQRLTPQGLDAEAAYLRAHPSFERPYGWAWLLMLTAQSARHGHRRWSEALAPVARAVADLLLDWLPKARYPVRHGTHANSAFALGLVLDSAVDAGLPELTGPVEEALRGWFADDTGGSLAWEPSGQDFLSPLLAEADAMRRILEPAAYAAWLAGFLPELDAAVRAGEPLLVAPPEVTDPADPQIGHLFGLCFSRAVALRGLAGAVQDERAAVLRHTADVHFAAGCRALGSGDFTTDHWLATFALLAAEAATPPPGA